MADQHDPAHVLVVDDVAENRRQLTQMLQAEGYRTTMADDGLAALDVLRQSIPDLVICDVSLPGMDGFQFLARMRGSETQTFVPVILITSRSDPQDKVRALDAGADDFLVKPIQKLELIARVRSLIRLKRSNDAFVRTANENAQLLRDARQRALELEALNQTALNITAKISLEEVLRSIIERACALVNATSGAIYLTDAQTKTLAVKAEYALPRSHMGSTIRFGEGVAGYVAASGNSMRINNYYEWSDKAPTYANDTFLTAVVGVPLVSGAQVVGVLDVMADMHTRVFNDEDVRLLNLLAPQAAIAITNALLYDTVAQERDRVNAILDSAYDGILMLDAAKKIAVVNTRFCEMTGIDAAALIGRDVAEIGALLGDVVQSVPPLNAETLARLLRDIDHSAELPVRRSFEMIEPQRASVEWAGLPVLDKDNRTLGWMNVLHDITQQRDLEHLRDDFISMLVHDLRTPLTNILGGVEVAAGIAAELATPDGDIQREFLDTATRNCYSLLGMISSLLEVSRLEAGKLPLTPTEVALADLVQQSVELVAQAARDKHVEIVLHIPSEAVVLYADVDKLQRVLVNLLGNAIKFSPAGMDVRLSATVEDAVRRRGLTAALRNGTGSLSRTGSTHLLGLRDRGTTGSLSVPYRAVLLTVSDDGQGIPADDLERIFDKFVQLPNGQAKGGSGLGLAFSKLVTEAHGGRIWAESRRGHGSTFHLSLPVVVDAPRPPAHAVG